jgi:transcription initiation factor TFIIIB Brf1 subunit/transcription initiation factor TFIIB
MDREIFENDEMRKKFLEKIEEVVPSLRSAILQTDAFQVEDASVTSSLDVDECPHDDVIDDGGQKICCECGLVTDVISFDAEWRYYGANEMRGSKDPARCFNAKISPRGIDSAVGGLPISEAVKKRAEQKYKKIVGEKIVRGLGRKAIVAACVLFAFRELGDIRTSDEVRVLFSLGKKQMSMGLTKYFEKFKEDRTKHIKPEHLIDRIMMLTGVPRSHKPKIIGLLRNVEKGSRVINRSSPQSVASSIIYLYLCMNSELKDKLGMSKSKFAEKILLSDLTIGKISKEAASIVDYILKQ